MARLNSCWRARAGESVPLVARHYHPWPLCRHYALRYRSLALRHYRRGSCQWGVRRCRCVVGAIARRPSSGQSRRPSPERWSADCVGAPARVSWYQDLGNATHRQINNIAFQIPLELLEGAECLGLELIEWITLATHASLYRCASHPGGRYVRARVYRAPVR